MRSRIGASEKGWNSHAREMLKNLCPLFRQISEIFWGGGGTFFGEGEKGKTPNAGLWFSGLLGNRNLMSVKVHSIK